MPEELEKMRRGEPYSPLDKELRQLRRQAREACARFNHHPSPGHLKRLKQLFDQCGEHCHIEPGLQLDYGTQIRLGSGVYLNFDCVVLDCSWVTLGDNTLVGPGVHFYTVTHPLDPEQRKTRIEHASPITVGANAWIGGRAVILPGVEIGDNAVVAAGAVVQSDVPANTLVAGVPAKIVRALDVADG